MLILIPLGLTKDVASDLTRCGAKAHYINSDLSQSRRENLMAAFRQGKLRILVVCKEY